MLVICAALAASIADPAATVTTLQVAPAVTVYGEPTAINVRVRRPLDDTPASGSVTIADGSAPLVILHLDDDGAASVSAMGLTFGEHQITARFAPADDSQEAASTSDAVAHDIEQAGSQVVVIVNDVDPIGRTSIITRVLAVSPSLGTPTGTVTLYLDSVAIGDADLFQGIASIPTRKLRVGNRAVVVHYSGDTNFVDSDSKETPLLVRPEDFEVAIAPEVAKMAPGDVEHVTLTLTPIVERDSKVSFVCGNLPRGATCTFDPPSLTLAADPQTVDVAISISGDLGLVLGLVIGAGAIGAGAFRAGAFRAGAFGVGGRRRRRKLLANVALFACLACGDARPLRSNTVTVIAVSENVNRTAVLTLQIR